MSTGDYFMWDLRKFDLPEQNRSPVWSCIYSICLYGSGREVQQIALLVIVSVSKQSFCTGNYEFQSWKIVVDNWPPRDKLLETFCSISKASLSPQEVTHRGARVLLLLSPGKYLWLSQGEAKETIVLVRKWNVLPSVSLSLWFTVQNHIFII